MQDTNLRRRAVIGTVVMEMADNRHLVLSLRPSAKGTAELWMADTVSAVRQIAIRKRHVTPVLPGRAYAAAAAGTPRPTGFPRGRSIEGFLFPSTYFFGPSFGALHRADSGEFTTGTGTIASFRIFNVTEIEGPVEMLVSF